MNEYSKISKGKCISLVLSAEGLGNSTKTLPGNDKISIFALLGVTKFTSKPSANASGFDYILAPPLRVLVSQHRPSASGLIP
jgi:hypothetical protein